MLYTYEALKQKAERRFDDGLLVKTHDTYEIDRTELRRWQETYASLCDEKDPKVGTMADIFAECATFVSFSDFLTLILTAYTRFLRDNGTNDYVLYYSDELKSNFWVAQILVFHGSQLLGDDYVPPYRITNDIDEFKEYLESSHSGRSLADFSVVLCDDASYSGKQLREMIDLVVLEAAEDGKELNITVLVSAMTTLAKRKIAMAYGEHELRSTIGIYFEMPLKTIPMMLDERLARTDLTRTERTRFEEWRAFTKQYSVINGVLDKYFTDFPVNDNDDEVTTTYNILINIPVYFEHKLPDSESSYPSMFVGYVTQKCGPHTDSFGIIKNCKLSPQSKRYFAIHGSSVDDDCATPFYKKVVSKSGGGGGSGGGKGGSKKRKQSKKSKEIWII